MNRREFLSKFAIGTGYTLATVHGLQCGRPGPKRPNIVYIMSDDLGWTELGCYGNDFNETPNLDKLATQSMRFTQAYASAPVCSPTRAAVLTGQFPARVGITDYFRPDESKGLSLQHITIAEMLKRAGYHTGLIGKWHLTGYAHHGSRNEIRATDHGFDEEIATEVKSVGNGANTYPYVFRNQKISWLSTREKRLPGDEYLTDRLNFEAVDFIERNAKQPFFLYLSHFAPHTILNGKESLVQKYRDKHPPGPSSRDKCYICQDAGFEGDPLNHWAQDHNPHLAAMIESIDDGVGMIVRKLEQLGIRENTIIIFASDNGGELNVTSNAPLRGGKSELYEGGLREPLIVNWPGMVPPNTVSDVPVNLLDFYPTVLDMTGLDPDPRQQLDGISWLPVLKNPQQSLDRDAHYWHYPLAEKHFLGGRSAGAIRYKNWKLIEFFDTGECEVYDLSKDPGEMQNLVQEVPEVAADLYRRLRLWREQNGFEIAPECANYNPIR